MTFSRAPETTSLTVRVAISLFKPSRKAREILSSALANRPATEV